MDAWQFLLEIVKVIFPALLVLAYAIRTKWTNDGEIRMLKNRLYHCEQEVTKCRNENRLKDDMLNELDEMLSTEFKFESDATLDWYKNAKAVAAATNGVVEVRHAAIYLQAREKRLRVNEMPKDNDDTRSA